MEGLLLRVLTFLFSYISIAISLAYLYPVESKAPIFYGANVLFIFNSVFFLSVFFFLVKFIKYGGFKKKVEQGFFYNYDCKRYIYIPILLSIVGILFLLIDRIYFRGINPFTLSPAVVRYMLNEGSGGISSVFSLFGNLLQCFNIVALYFMVTRNVNKKVILISLFLISLLSSILLGGRTPILCFLVIFLSLQIQKSSFYRPKKLLAMFFILCLFILFTAVIFSLRADATGLKSDEYAINLLRHLNFDPSNIYLAADNVFDDIYNYTLIVFAYALHPFAISSDAVLYGSGQGNVSFYALLFLFSKFLPIDMDSMKHDYYEMFVSLPGGLYYDFGLFGVVFVAGLLGFILSLSYKRLLLNSQSDVARILFTLIIAVLIFSPLLNALNFVFFLFYATLLFGYFVFFRVIKGFMK